MMCYSAESLPPDGWEVFRIRNTVQAVRITEPFEVKGRDGKTHMCRDGWLVKATDGQPYCVPDAVFTAAYEAI